jgi:hypothetical protein
VGLLQSAAPEEHLSREKQREEEDGYGQKPTKW